MHHRQNSSWNLKIIRETFFPNTWSALQLKEERGDTWRKLLKFVLDTGQQCPNKNLLHLKIQRLARNMLISLRNLLPLFYQPVSFLWKMCALSFFGEQTELQSPSLLLFGGDPAMINQNYFLPIFVTTKKSINFKFENFSFAKFPENIVIRHAINL